MEKTKQWRCKNNHIMGFIRWNVNGLPQLMLLREALDMDVEHPHETDLLGTLDGRMNVRCSICDAVSVWEISVDSLVAMFEQLPDKKVLEFSQRLLEMSSKVLDLEDPAAVKE
jgi:LSD1 subclass zinc finger protein